MQPILPAEAGRIMVHSSGMQPILPAEAGRIIESTLRNANWCPRIHFSSSRQREKAMSATQRVGGRTRIALEEGVETGKAGVVA